MTVGTTDSRCTATAAAATNTENSERIPEVDWAVATSQNTAEILEAAINVIHTKWQ